MYMTLSEKRAYVDQDFKKSPLLKMGDMQKDAKARQAYWHEAVKYANEFEVRYQDRGKIHDYVLEVVNDYLDTLEKAEREIIANEKRGQSDSDNGSWSQAS